MPHQYKINAFTAPRSSDSVPKYAYKMTKKALKTHKNNGVLLRGSKEEYIFNKFGIQVAYESEIAVITDPEALKNQKPVVGHRRFDSSENYPPISYFDLLTI